MSKEKAKAHYLGLNGHERLNCGQTIVNAFKEKFGLSDEIMQQFQNYGGGRAPEGHCGSFYAAKFILENRNPDKLKECESAFLSRAGSTRCKDIRLSRSLSCLDCVERVAQCLDDV